MKSNSMETILLTALTICMAAALAVTTPQIEKSADHEARYGALVLDALTSR